MIHKNINDLMEVAAQRIEFAEKELSRPSADSVTFTVCHFSNHAIRDLLVSLIAYNYLLEFPEDDLIKDTLKTISRWDIEFMMEYSSKLDPEFGKVDISFFQCGSLEENEVDEAYCLELGTVRRCADAARKIEVLVKQYLNNVTVPKDNSVLHKTILQTIH